MHPSCISELDITNAIKARYGAYVENDIKSVILVDDDDEDEFIIRIVTEEHTVCSLFKIFVEYLGLQLFFHDSSPLLC